MDENSLLSWRSMLRYLNRLHVFGIGDRSDSSITDLELGVDSNQQKMQLFELGANSIEKPQDKIIAALKLLPFREQHVIVQFWSPGVVGKQQLLTTIDQPFGLGVVDVGLCTYRRDSECHSFFVNKDHEDEDHSPVARVFRRGLPEWTFDLNSYTKRQFPQQASAIRCGLHGYLGLPVFDSALGSCVGVIEILTSSKYTSYAYEVQQIHKALETVDLRTHQPFDCPTLNVPSERRQKALDILCGILKKICDVYCLPLALTWAVSQNTSFVSHEKVLRKSCSSFDIKCVGKECMSRAGLPFHVKNIQMWPFFNASTQQHMYKSHGLVGKALSNRGSCFCGDLTRLGEQEYPLVHNARMNGLTSCFAIFLHSVEAGDEYVLEFFLTPDMKEMIHVLNLLQTLKQQFEIASGFELGDSSCIDVVEPFTQDAIPLSIDTGTIQVASGATINNNQLDTVTSDSESMVVNMTITDSASVTNEWPIKQMYLDKFRDSITSTENLVGDDCIRHDSNVISVRENDNIISYPNESMQSMSDGGEKGKSSKKGRKRKIDSLTMDAVEKHVGKPMDEAAKSLGVGRSTLKRFCRDHDMPSWPLPKQSKKTNTNLNPSQKSLPSKTLQTRSNIRFGVCFVVFLMVRVKRWSCLSKNHGYSGKWWSCGMHKSLPFKSNFIYQTARLIVQLRRWRNKISKRNAMHNRVSVSTAKPKYTTGIINEYSCVSESTLVRAFPKQTVPNVSDTKTVTVKVTYKDDMIKFQFPISSGLLELQHEVARRIKLERRKVWLKYTDEDNDLISLASDDDLNFLLMFAANNSTIRLIIVDGYS